MTNSEKAMQLLVENDLLYANSYQERKNLIHIYNTLNGKDVEKKSEPEQFDWWVLYAGLAAIVTALSFLAYLSIQ